MTRKKNIASLENFGQNIHPWCGAASQSFVSAVPRWMGFSSCASPECESWRSCWFVESVREIDDYWILIHDVILMDLSDLSSGSSVTQDTDAVAPYKNPFHFVSHSLFFRHAIMMYHVFVAQLTWPLFHLEYLRTIFHLQHNWQDWKLSRPAAACCPRVFEWLDYLQW